MTTATLTPFAKSAAHKVGRRMFRKRILPLDTIDYKGQKITFDQEYLRDLAESFNSAAYDQVPFVLADRDNAHNMDPERFRGDVKALELTADGLDAILEVNEAGAKVLEDNPHLGVSARLVEGLAKSDGRTFKRAIQHVLGTMDPRVTGLGPWQAVDLSEADADIQVVDLTTSTYEGDTVTAPAQPKSDADTPLDLSSLSQEDLDALLADADDDSTKEPVTDPNPTPEVAPHVVEVDPADVPDDTAVHEVVVDDSTLDSDVDNTDLSVVMQATRDNLDQVRNTLAQERFQTERGNLVRAGVPPFLIDLAAPLLSSPDAVTIDLSNSDTPVNATEVVRNLLAGVKGLIEVTPEIGHQVDLSETTDPDAAALAAWDIEYGTF